MNKTFSRSKVQRLTLLALMTALVIVLQLLVVIKLGAFNISVVMMPIVVGAALLGPSAGAWLGFVFGVTVLLSGDAALFMSYSVIGTVITVIVKGTVAGACAGWIYRLFESKNKWIAAITASAIAPVVNTGIFFIGSAVFFFNDLTAFASTVGYDSFVSVMFGYIIGFNFIAEFAFNLIVTPVIYRVIDLGVGMADKKATERH